MGKDVIVALDFDSKEKTLAFLDRFTEEKPFVKIGMELFYAEGPAIVREIRRRGHRIFLDLKLHDIPNTVKKAMAALSALDVDIINLHAAGTAAMMTAALEGLPAPKEPNLQARMNALRRQVEEMVEQKGEFVAMPQARAQTMHYMKGLKGAASLRRYCCELSRLSDLDTLIDAVFEQQRRAAQDPDDTREVPFP